MAVDTGDEVNALIDELWAMQPCPLLGSGSNSVRLWAWAEGVAEDLHRRFPALGIVVGYMRYPERAPERQVDFDAHYSRMPGLDPTRVRVALDGPLTVASGHDGHHRVIVTNLSSTPMVVWTNGRITAHVLDPRTGRVVGISTRAQALPGVSYRAEPNGNVAVPLVVGTASVDPELGYALRVGTWDLRATVSVVENQTTGRSDHLTPPLRFEIV